MRIMIVQHAGDYREAFLNITNGYGETYYAQKYSIDAVAKLRQFADDVATLCCLTKERYDELLPNGVRAIGSGMRGKLNVKEMLKQVEAYQPTHLVVRNPDLALLNWAAQYKIPTIATLADSFTGKSIFSKARNYKLASALNRSTIQWVGNHGVNASKSLQKIGVSADKIIPWDWPHSSTPRQFTAKELSTAQVPRSLVYVGSLIEAKGVGDILKALAILKSKEYSIQLKLAGTGDTAAFQAKAAQLNIADSVEFLGRIENKSVIELMRSADLVLVPSRHEYPEGFPMTIYEALCSRTPIVASNHSMFLEQLQHQVSAMIFASGDASALADSVQEILANPSLYEQISQASLATWERLQVPVKWADLLYRWVRSSAEDRDWLFKHRLASGVANEGMNWGEV